MVTKVYDLVKSLSLKYHRQLLNFPSGEFLKRRPMLEGVYMLGPPPPGLLIRETRLRGTPHLQLFKPLFEPF